MRLRDLYEAPEVSTAGTDLPIGVRHTLPHTVIFPEMDSYQEFYKFVIAMASHPELDDTFYQKHDFRDVPLAVAYTPQEFDMIKAVAKRMGHKWKEVAFTQSREPPGGNIVSPVMKYNMTESHIDIMKALLAIMENEED
jgi:hypothetical protein